MKRKLYLLEMFWAFRRCDVELADFLADLSDLVPPAGDTARKPPASEIADYLPGFLDAYSQLSLL